MEIMSVLNSVDMKNYCEHQWSDLKITQVNSEHLFYTKIRRFGLQTCLKCNLVNKIEL